jgi:hypothetical protein
VPSRDDKMAAAVKMGWGMEMRSGEDTVVLFFF